MISVRCAKCGWAWNTKSKAWRISCPGCGIKVTVWSNVNAHVERVYDKRLRKAERESEKALDGGGLV